MFSIKDAVFGKKKHDADYGDIRSHVINKPFLEPQSQTVKEKFGFERQDFPRDPYAPEPFTPPPQAFSPQPPGRMEEQGFEQYPVSKPLGSRPDPRMDFGAEREQRKDYDILDRLNIIESQLQAIRSQTETINERLKNIDARLGVRRY
jgi:hypothetical protein